MESERLDLFVWCRILSTVTFISSCPLKVERVWFSKTLFRSIVLGTEDAQIRQLASDSWASYVVVKRNKKEIKIRVKYNNTVKDKEAAMSNCPPLSPPGPGRGHFNDRLMAELDLLKINNVELQGTKSMYKNPLLSCIPKQQNFRKKWRK